MTVEEKAGVLRTYCASRIGCAGCPLALDSIHHKHTCYSFWYKFPEDIERNYDLIFGNETEIEESKCKNDDEEEKKMTVEEKSNLIRAHCDSVGCYKCPLDNLNEKHTCYSFWREYPEDIERNYDLIFGNDTNSDEEKDEDMVNHPSHYTSGGVECIDAITAALSKYDDPVDSWLVGQVIKYLWRAPLKGKYDEDIKKAQFYLNRLVEKIDKNG